MISGNLFNLCFMNHMIICWKYNLCVVFIFPIESDEEIITNERILPRDFRPLGISGLSDFMIGFRKKLVQNMIILSRNFKTNLCSLGKSKHHERKKFCSNNELYLQSKISYSAQGSFYQNTTIEEKQICVILCLNSLFTVHFKITFDLFSILYGHYKLLTKIHVDLCNIIFLNLEVECYNRQFSGLSWSTNLNVLNWQSCIIYTYM